jgi:hypothetical protein
MNTDKERENILKKAAIALERLKRLDSIVDSLYATISISFAFSSSVFICVHPWFQRFSSCA